ncbi:hypothetical protein V6N12_007953 [Hibiscus sabdariffa]|uniref:Uncharacterized protein n=1 Tax=Hibiscus sabdariffa TaxID=183260 RepID=A0ABR2BU78_9ROSI
MFPFTKEKSVSSKIVYPVNENNTVTESVFRKKRVTSANEIVPANTGTDFGNAPDFGNDTQEIVSDFGQGSSMSNSAEHIVMAKQQPLVVPTSRPARNRKLPQHLKDYENIRRFRSANKKAVIKLIRKQRCGMVFLQETMLEEVITSDVCSEEDLALAKLRMMKIFLRSLNKGMFGVGSVGLTSVEC